MDAGSYRFSLRLFGSRIEPGEGLIGPVKSIVRRIATIPQAVVVLGFDTVKSLALGVSVFGSLQQKVGKVSFDREQFWMHSIGCAEGARLVAKSQGRSSPE